MDTSERSGMFPSRGVCVCRCWPWFSVGRGQGRARPCCSAALLSHWSCVGEWVNQKAVDDRGGWTNRFSVSLPFLKILSLKTLGIFQEIMSPGFDSDSLKTNYIFLVASVCSTYKWAIGCWALRRGHEDGTARGQSARLHRVTLHLRRHWNRQV